MPRYALKFISGPYQGGEILLPEQQELLIGRTSDLDLVLAEDMVSRKHAKLTAGRTGLELLDLGSTNGTFVNGEKIRRAMLAHNDRVLIGTSILKIIAPEEMSAEGQEFSEAKSFKEMLSDVVHRAPRATSMSGDLEEVPLPDLLQLFGANKKSGVLTIFGAHRGKVYIRQGQILTAVVSGEVVANPMKTLCRMIQWTKGGFRVESFEDDVQFKETFQEPTESVLMEALRQVDELRRLMTDLPPLHAKFSLCIPMTPSLSTLSQKELDTLQLVINFSEHKTIQDKSQETDLVVATHMKRLLKEGYVEEK